MSGILDVTITIGGTVWKLTPEAYKEFNKAESAYIAAKTARDKALGEPVRYPKGICNFWIPNVILTKEGNQFIPVGARGDLNVMETSVDGKVILALFHPQGRLGFGQVRRPEFTREGR